MQRALFDSMTSVGVHVLQGLHALLGGGAGVAVLYKEHGDEGKSHENGRVWEQHDHAQPVHL